jgi:hypothetical protein
MEPRLIKVLRVHLVSSGEWKYRVHDPVGIAESSANLEGLVTELISYFLSEMNV